MNRKSLDRRVFVTQKVLWIIIFTLLPVVLYGQSASHSIRPAWLDKPPMAQNDTYKFIIESSTDADLDNARLSCLNYLANDKSLLENVSISSTSMLNSNSNSISNEKGIHEVITNSFTLNTVIKGTPQKLQAIKVAEYWQYQHGRYYISVLYMVGTSPKPHFNNVIISNQYGVSEIGIKSLIPGCAQFYKGSITKGICFISLETAAVGGIILGELMRTSYVRLQIEDKKHIKEYGQMADNWTNIRNMSIVATAAIYAWNIIDALIVPGAEYISFPFGGNASLYPSLNSEKPGFGLSLSYNF